jgi:hypothetical protein
MSQRRRSTYKSKSCCGGGGGIALKIHPTYSEWAQFERSIKNNFWDTKIGPIAKPK